MFEESDLKNLNSCSESSLAFDLTAVRNLTSFKAGGRSFILRPSTQQCKLFQQVHPVLYNVHKAPTKDKHTVGAGGDQQGGQGHQGAVGGAEEVAQALVLLLRHHWVGGDL